MSIKLLIAGLLPVLLVAQAPRLVQQAEIVEAMRHERTLGYDVLATSNGARFSAGVLLDIARRTGSQGPALINHRDYYDAFLQVTGLTPERAPIFVRIANEFGEDQFIDPRPEKVIRKVNKGRAPKLALNVVCGWHSGGAGEYSYDDKTSTPNLRVIHKRITSYRLLDFGDMLLFDEITGIEGRATSGLLGAMFTVIGDGTAVRSFSAVAMDGAQVTLTTAKKFFTITQAATVTPDGKGSKGLPPNRPDLEQLEKRLRQPFEADYVPLKDNPDQWPAGPR